MTARDTLYLQNGSVTAEEDRALLDAMNPQFGVLRPGDWLVTQNGTPNMSVNVAAGRGIIDGTESALQGSYLGWLDATQNTVIAASDPTNPRIDLIVARIKDQQYSGASNTFTVEAVTGTPAGSPVAPTAPANSYVIAQIAVAASAATIVTANITDRRKGVGPWFTGWGVMGVGSVVADPAAFSALADVPAASVTFTAVAGRFYAVTCSFGGGSQNTSTGTSAVVVTDGSNNRVGLVQQYVAQLAGTTLQGATRRLVIGGLGAGAATYKARATTTAGTVTLHADTGATYGPMTVTVEDIGSATTA